MKKNPIASLALLVLQVACGSTSNLDEKPGWTNDGILPPDHPSGFDRQATLSVVSLGTATTLESAISKSREDAEQEFLKKLTRPAITALGSSGKVSSAYKKQVEELAEKNAYKVLAYLEKAVSWDGFQEETQYHYGLYVIDRQEASDALLNGASETYDRVKAIQNGLGDEQLSNEERERRCLEALQAILALSVVKEQARALDVGGELNWIEDFNRLEQKATDQVLRAGDRREEAGTEDDLREALSFYQEASKQKPSPLFAEAIARTEQRLPCGDCKSTVASANGLRAQILDLEKQISQGVPHPENGRLAVKLVQTSARYEQVCTHGHAFFDERVTQVREHSDVLARMSNIYRMSSKEILESGARFEQQGSERELEQALELYQQYLGVRSDAVASGRIQKIKRALPCTECGRGQKCVQCRGSRGQTVSCSRCVGNQQVLEDCSTCDGDGKTRCRSCGGGGHERLDCRSCSSGQVRCGACNGRGSTDTVCLGCAGLGIKFVGASQVTCYTCNGSGKGQFPCFLCGSTGRQSCSQCGGSTYLESTCRRCGGEGRSGQCSRCDGRTQVYVPCTSCSDGTEFRNCSNCNGRGVCPTCGGRGHRH